MRCEIDSGRLPDWVWGLTTDEAYAFIGTLISWNGYNPKHSYWTNLGEQFCNDLQRLCLHAGLSCNINSNYGNYMETVVWYGTGTIS